MANMKERHITIKLTESQLNEAQDDAFVYLTSSDTVPYNGQTEVSADGKLDGIEDADPTTTDKFASMLTTQGYNRYGYLRGTFPKGVKEMQDKNGDGVDDFYNSEQLDIMSNGDPNDNLTAISDTIDDRTDKLIAVIKGIPSKKQAMVLNKIIESMDLQGIPYKWKKELIKKIGVSSR